ncbi:respiratory nitrate reductase, gamma subunit [Denitrovibrio acetiphilus DSM 12809]|uniref:Respiratory nitrate reductase, gamma subunit n=1 Tax=Denitrovibrio acetiphilus (strain DSM 12809 / NBRC 114555 / N2460) TaxID=522772 RepID=D4H1S0_DENA2|nr:respiratory nitrate reductase subunit gamma [Denitrovibrio acetiphilus]ADD68830.1 respiratory nitrate reductase, gamma subunit [Denitrovibrio acetiphilus DSM 12809]
MLNTFMFIIFPYICLSVMILGLVTNIMFAGLRISAPATGFFEKKKLFWGIVPWHFGILTVLLGHLIGLVFPWLILNISSSKGALMLLEIVALGGGFAALFGVTILLLRRVGEETLFASSGSADYIALLLLCIQVVLGISVAVAHRWGISWFASNMSGYLWSLIIFRPSVAYVTGIPAVLSAHIMLGFLLMAILPFTRLMHLVYVPVLYLFRKPQIVRGYEKA